MSAYCDICGGYHGRHGKTCPVTLSTAGSEMSVETPIKEPLKPADPTPPNAPKDPPKSLEKELKALMNLRHHVSALYKESCSVQTTAEDNGDTVSESRAIAERGVLESVLKLIREEMNKCH